MSDNIININPAPEPSCDSVTNIQSENIDTPLPATALLSASERLRLGQLAASGTAPVEPLPAEPAMEFPTFNDGSFFKFLPRKGFEPQCVLVAADGQQVAICKNEGVSDLICNSLNLFLLATLKNEGPLTIVAPPIIIPAPK